MTTHILGSSSPLLLFHLTSLAPNYTAVFLLKKILITPSRKRSLYYATESWKMHLHLTLRYKIASSSQNLRIRYNPQILRIISLSFASLLITVSSPDSIYLYLDIFLLKFLFISKPSEWVLTSRFSPVTLSLHSPNIKECISLISQVLVQPELLRYRRTPYFMYLSSGDSQIFFFPHFRQCGLSQQKRNCWLPLRTQHSCSKPQWKSAHKKD